LTLFNRLFVKIQIHGNQGKMRNHHEPLVRAQDTSSLPTLTVKTPQGKATNATTSSK
jgi:hypothetical protein